MQTGAFALIDALGFKGIWRKYSEDQILGKLRKMKEDEGQAAESGNAMPGPYGAPGLFGSRRTSFLSDTIAMAAEIGKDYPDPHLTPKGRALVWLTLHVAALLRSAAMTDPPLAYRGCISFGAFAVEDPFILGPAVDAAAELHNLAEGAFVWLDEGARDILKCEPVASEPGFPHTQYLHMLDVPLKNGRTVETFVVVPYGAGYRAKARVNERLLSSFEGATVDVSAKRENTRAFLSAAHEASNAAFYRLDRHEQFMHGLTDNGPGS